MLPNFLQVLEVRNSLPEKAQNPLLVKIAPDLTDNDKEDIAAVVTREKVWFYYRKYETKLFNGVIVALLMCCSCVFGESTQWISSNII